MSSFLIIFNSFICEAANNDSGIPRSPSSLLSTHDHQRSPMSPAPPVGNGVVDKFVIDFPDQYPNGNKPKYITKVEGVNRNKKPVVNWAKDMSHNVSKCLGVFVCPHFQDGCEYRVRPQVPRRGTKTTAKLAQPAEHH